MAVSSNVFELFAFRRVRHGVFIEYSDP